MFGLDKLVQIVVKQTARDASESLCNAIQRDCITGETKSSWY